MGVQPDDSRHDEAVYNAVKDKLIQYEREQYDLSSKIDFIRVRLEFVHHRTSHHINYVYRNIGRYNAEGLWGPLSPCIFT